MTKKLKCILLIDDDEATNFLHRRLIELESAAEQVHTVNSGVDGLDYITSRGAFKINGDTFPRPELVFLDINMPGMNGWDFLKEYYQLKERSARVVVLTSSPNPDDRKRAEKFAALDDFLVKPMTRQALTQVIAKHFR